MLKPFYVVNGRIQFCPGDGCLHYGTATKYPRKCYYEPQCWRGYLDVVLSIVRLRWQKYGK